MSELKVASIKGLNASSAAISIDNSSGTCTANISSVGGGALSHRRMNINGAVLINQRGNKTGLTVSGAPHYVVDRFRHYFTEGTFSISQENDAPAGTGFTKSLKIQCTTADTSQDAGAVHNLTYPFEGQDLQGLAKGTSGAKQLAVQFWCKAYQTGTFTISLFDEDNMRFTNQNFTISASNTWEKKELVFPADTTGTITADNSASLNLDIKLAAGSNSTSGSLQTAWAANTTANSAVGQTVNIADNTNNNFYITGLQIEMGNVHTDFEHRSFAEELTLCHRYYYKLKPAASAYFGAGFSYNSNTFICHIDFPVIMRANVTALEQTGTADHYKVIHNGTTSTCSSVPTFLGDPNNTSQSVAFPFNGSLTQGQGGLGRSGNASAFFGFDAEL